MSSNKIVFISRVVVIRRGIWFREWDIHYISLTFKVKYSKNLMLSWQLHEITRKTPHTNIFNMAATVIHDISSLQEIFRRISLVKGL